MKKVITKINSIISLACHKIWINRCNNINRAGKIQKDYNQWANLWKDDDNDISFRYDDKLFYENYDNIISNYTISI